MPRRVIGREANRARLTTRGATKQPGALRPTTDTVSEPAWLDSPASDWSRSEQSKPNNRRRPYTRARKRPCVWSGQRDSNPRPSAPKADALPDCAMPRPRAAMIRGAPPQVNLPAHIISMRGFLPFATLPRLVSWRASNAVYSQRLDHRTSHARTDH